MKSSYSIGHIGEDIASRILQDHSFCVLHKRFKTKSGEIDVVALDEAQHLLVFCEVKIRKHLIEMQDVITSYQWKRIVAASNDFLADHHHYSRYSFRYDQILITYSQIPSSEDDIKYTTQPDGTISCYTPTYQAFYTQNLWL